MVDVNKLPKGNGKKLLVVEDDVLVLEALRQMLTQLDYEFVTEESPAAAIETAKSMEDLDGMISDVVMPEISGHELWRHLLTAGKRVPTLFMSGYLKSDFPLREHDVRLIKKPVEIDQLAKALQALFSHHAD